MNKQVRQYRRKVFVVCHTKHGVLGFDGAKVSGFASLDKAQPMAALARRRYAREAGERYTVFVRPLVNEEIPDGLVMIF